MCWDFLRSFFVQDRIIYVKYPPVTAMKAIWNPVQRVSVGSQDTLEEVQQKVLDAFWSSSVSDITEHVRDLMQRRHGCCDQVSLFIGKNQVVDTKELWSFIDATDKRISKWIRVEFAGHKKQD